MKEVPVCNEMVLVDVFITLLPSLNQSTDKPESKSSSVVALQTNKNVFPVCGNPTEINFKVCVGSEIENIYNIIPGFHFGGRAEGIHPLLAWSLSKQPYWQIGGNQLVMLQLVIFQLVIFQLVILLGSNS